MKKALCLLLSLVMILTTSFIMPVSATAAANTTTVDLSATHQTMNGFGASACWWSQDVGGWSNLDDVMSLLYSKDKGIGLNIYRYNLGAGSVNDGGHYPEFRNTECFLNADGTYNWNSDANAQKALASAKKLAGNNLRVTLFCNSAPIYMTKNGKGYCSTGWNDSNLDAENYEAFADYTLNCADYFLGKGYRVTDVSPINEPCYTWLAWDWEEEGLWAGQEGCHYSREDVRDLGKVFFNKYKGSDAASKGCEVSLFEASEMGCAVGDDTTPLEEYLECLFSTSGTFYAKNKTIRDNVKTIGMHSYWSSVEGKTETARLLKEDYKGKYQVAQTEYCQMEGDIFTGVYDLVNSECGGTMTSGLTMPYGIALANIICDDLTILDVVEWDWWTACAYGGYTDGLVYLDKDTHKIDTSKRLWVLGNFSKFTDEGSVRVDSTTTNTDVKTVAFSNPDGTVSVVLINNAEAAQTTKLSLTGTNANCYSYSSYVTDENNDLKASKTGNISDSTVSLPAKSVTTVVVKPTKATTPTVTTCQHKETSKVTAAKSGKDGKIVKTCSVCGKTLSTTTINAIGKATLSKTSYTYDGKAKKPTVTVKDSKGKTIAASNYKVTYSNNKNVGKASAKITFTGNYSGTQTLNFTINPKATTLSSVSAKSKAFKLKWKKQSTQTTGYEIQYSTDKSFKKSVKTEKIKKNSTTSATIKKLKAKKKYYVRIRTYKTVSKTTYYSDWSKSMSVKTKK